MARVRADQPLLPSVLDRLIDAEPGQSREIAKARHQVLRELKHSVRRDLEHFLNTRWKNVPLPEHLHELDRSLVNYGIPDFTGLTIGSAGAREEFRRIIEAAIRKFEPRFKRVRVQLLDNVEPLDRTLRFRIEAMLRVDPAPEPVVFDSAVEPSTGNFQVTEEA